MATHSSVLAWRIPGTGESGIDGVAQSQTRLKRLSSSCNVFKYHLACAQEVAVSQCGSKVLLDFVLWRDQKKVLRSCVRLVWAGAPSARPRLVT